MEESLYPDPPDQSPDPSGAPASADPAAETPRPDRDGPSYQPFTLPEGFIVDAAGMSAFTGLAQESGLSQEQAQRYLDLAAEHARRAQEAQRAEWGRTAEQWIKTLKTDPELGGPGFEDNIHTARQVLRRFGSEDLNTLLGNTGWGNHPELIRALVRIGKALGEDTPPGAGVAARTRDVAAILYPDHER